MRFFFAIAAIALLGACAHTPHKYLTPPSTVPVRKAVAVVQTAINQAQSDIDQLQEDKTLTPAQRAQLDVIEEDVHAAAHATAQTNGLFAELDQNIEKQTTTANSAIDQDAIDKAKAKRNAQWRNRFLLIALALAVWIFRKPLLSLGKKLLGLLKLALPLVGL